MIFFIFLLVIFSVALLSVAIYSVFNLLRKRRTSSSLKTALFLVKIPKESLISGQRRIRQNKLSLIEQFLNELTFLRFHFVLEFAVPHVSKKEVSFYLMIPKKYTEVVDKQIKSLWSSASIKSVSGDYNVFHPQGAVAAAYFLEKENHTLPVRSHQETDIDNSSSILAELSKIKEIGEGAAFQLVVRLEARKKILKSLLSKTIKPLFEVNARLITSAVSPFQANDLLSNLLMGFSQFNSSTEGRFHIVKPRNPQNLVRQFSFRVFDDRQKIILNSGEIANFLL